MIHRLLVWDIVKAPALTRTADRVLNPLIGKSLVVYVRKPDVVSKRRDEGRSLPQGVPDSRGPTSPTHGAAA